MDVASLFLVFNGIVTPTLKNLNESRKRVRESSFAIEVLENDIVSRPGRGYMEAGSIRRPNNQPNFNHAYIDRIFLNVKDFIPC